MYYFLLVGSTFHKTISHYKTSYDFVLEVLVEELQEIWQEVQAYNASAFLEQHKLFNLQAILMWTIHDYSAYGLISSCSTKGYIACPKCGPNFLKYILIN